MKARARIAVMLLLAAAICLPQLSAQPAMQAGGMAELQAHGIRGDVTAVSADALTVKTEEGEVYTVATGPNTRFRKQRDSIRITDLHPGDMIAAFGDKDPKAHTLGAMFVMLIDRAQYQQMRAGFGKTWTAGVVESISGTDIVIKRPDNTTQTVAVDENTSFRRHREDITLPDIKPGDNLTARGALHNGSFLATLVSVGRGRPGAGNRRFAPQESDATQHRN